MPVLRKPRVEFEVVDIAVAIIRLVGKGGKAYPMRGFDASVSEPMAC